MADTTKPEPKKEDKSKALARVETSVCGLVLNNLEDMTTVAQVILQSRLAPESFDTKEKIFVGLQAGAEIGLKPMQSLNSIVVIHGKPTLWGDAALALVKRSGLCEYCKEYYELKGVKLSGSDVQYADLIGYPDGLMAVCETKAFRDPLPVIRYFSVADAKLATLWKKKGPWTTHPKRMLKYKARAFNLRDNFPDVLFGMHLAEEIYGEEPLPAPETDVKPRGDRRAKAVPSTTLTTERAPVQEAEAKIKEITEAVAEIGAKAMATTEAKTADPDADARAEDANEPQEKPEPSTEKKGDLATLYEEVTGMYAAQNGQDFSEFAPYVLCVDETEVDAPSKFTMEQLRQIKAYIETNGTAIN